MALDIDPRRQTPTISMVGSAIRHDYETLTERAGDPPSRRSPFQRGWFVSSKILGLEVAIVA
jgi:hypothetical protein